MFDIIALGELLIDFTHFNCNADNPVFEANPGGAPCNVLAMLAKLNKKTAFMGKVGDDMFGQQLKAALIKASISCQGLILDKNFNTTLAFVKNLPDGDRQFSFYRTNSADTQLTEDEIDIDLIKNTRLFHFGSLSLTHASARSATMAAVTAAKNNDVIISFDPNLREALWDNMDNAKQRIIWGVQNCNILKLSKEELVFISGSANIDFASKEILSTYDNIKLLLITDGKKGSVAYYENLKLCCAASSHKAIDTTGAGDTFFACCLNTVLENGLSNLTEAVLQNMLCFASAAAGLITTRKGAMSQMPEFNEIIKNVSFI